MSVGLLIITHGTTGQSLVEVGEFILGQSLESIHVISFAQSGESRTSKNDIHQGIKSVDHGEGVLVLTDLLGASPCNLVTQVIREYRALAVTGVNLAMLIRLWNYRDQPLEALAKIAEKGGKRGVEVIEP